MALFLQCDLLELDDDAIMDYLHHLKRKHKTPSDSFFKHTVYGLRYLFRLYDKESSKVVLPSIERPKKYPVVLNRQEVKDLLIAPTLLRHRLIIGLLYGCGLRNHELCKLKITDLDLQRQMLHVREGLTEEVAAQIDRLLEDNARKRRSGLHKQVLKKCDILTVLHQKGYRIGYTTVCNYISKKEQRSSEAFIRQRYQPGSVCEFDWGEVKLHIQGKRTVLQMAVFTSGYSNYRYACLFYRQDTLAFMESHVKFFAHAGGVYHQMVYDNMRVAVARFAGRNEKEPTQALANLKGHYQFHHRFCNSYRGNEKGHVERSVEYIRRKAFGFRDDFSSIGQAQAYLGKVVEKLNRTPRQQTDKTSQDLFNQEQQALWDAPTPFSCYSTEQLRVDKYATVSYCHNRYSVPDHLVGEFVDVKIYSDQLKLYYQDQQVATHKRSYGAHTWTIRLDHYLDTLHKKPGALGNSEGLAQSSGQLRALYSKYYQQVPRDFIELLIYCRKHRISKERLYDAEQALLRICPTDINTEKLMALLGNTTSPRPTTVHGHDKKIQQASKAHLLALTNLVGN
jgi:transposase